MSSFGRQTYEYGDVNLDLASVAIPSFLDIEWAAIIDPMLVKGHDSVIRASGRSPIRYWRWVGSATSHALFGSAPYLATTVDKLVALSDRV